MIYMAFFSFTGYGDDPDSDLDHGHSCCVTEARDLPEAWAKFRKLINSYRMDTDDLDQVAMVYLQNVIEIGQLPIEGLVAQWTWQTQQTFEDGQKGVQIVGVLTYPPETSCKDYSYPDPDHPVLRELPPAFVEFKRGVARLH